MPDTELEEPPIPPPLLIMFMLAMLVLPLLLECCWSAPLTLPELLMPMMVASAACRAAVPTLVALLAWFWLPPDIRLLPVEAEAPIELMLALELSLGLGRLALTSSRGIPSWPSPIPTPRRPSGRRLRLVA